MRNSGSSIPFPERIIEEFAQNGSRKIEEEDIEDDTGNVSETVTQPASNSLTPRKLIIEETKINNPIKYGLSNPSTGGHTRTNSSKAQSLKGSIIIQKPTNLSSQFTASLVSSSHNPYGLIGDNTNNTRKNLSQKKIQQHNSTTYEETKKAELNREVDEYLSQVPGSFVCTGGTEFHQCEQRP